MTWIARYVTPWDTGTGPGGEDANVPKLSLAGIAWEQGDGWSDVTGQPAENITPTPNAFTVEVRVQSESTLDSIASHPDGYVELWREEVSDGIPG